MSKRFIGCWLGCDYELSTAPVIPGDGLSNTRVIPGSTRDLGQIEEVLAFARMTGAKELMSF
ncbi:MAG: hypothetical protein ACR2QW_07890 [bacterium]